MCQERGEKKNTPPPPLRPRAERHPRTRLLSVCNGSAGHAGQKARLASNAGL